MEGGDGRGQGGARRTGAADGIGGRARWPSTVDGRGRRLAGTRSGAAAWRVGRAQRTSVADGRGRWAQQTSAANRRGGRARTWIGGQRGDSDGAALPLPLVNYIEYFNK